MKELNIESTDRLAWTQTVSQGMGSGFDAFNHSQKDLGKEEPDTTTRKYDKT